MQKRILIVDDRAIVRSEIRNLLELAGTVAVVGEAEDGWEAVHQAEYLRPDIVLMDLEMPGMDGFEATRLIKKRHLAQVVIAFTVYDCEPNRQKAREAGADAFVVKGTDLFDLLKLFDQIIPQED